MYYVWVPREPDPPRRADVPRVIDPSADEPTLRTTLAGLTYEELVSAWHSSERRLATEADTSRRGVLVAFRGLLLDEVESRSSRRYRRWLRRGGPTRPSSLPRDEGPVRR